MFEIIWMIFWMDDSTNHLKPAKQTQDVHILCDWSGSNFQHVSTSGTQENSGTQPQTETNHIHRGSYKRLLRNLHRKKWCTKDFKWTSSETKNNGSPWKKNKHAVSTLMKIGSSLPKNLPGSDVLPTFTGIDQGWSINRLAPWASAPDTFQSVTCCVSQKHDLWAWRKGDNTSQPY
jgi:hypothetical protein